MLYALNTIFITAILAMMATMHIMIAIAIHIENKPRRD